MTEPAHPSPSASQPSVLGRIWTFIRILNVRLRFILLMVLVGLIAGHWDGLMNRYDRWRRPARAAETVPGEEIEYYCPMHPNIIRSEPGNCPICGMPLSKRERKGAAALPEGVLARVQLTPFKVQIGRIGTSSVGYQLLSRDIRTVGIVDYDETRRAFIAARVKGRIEHLFVNYVGQHVEQGEPLASIYSPDLLVAQRELLEAVRSVEETRGAGGVVQSAAQSLLDATRRKLLLWGVTEEQIDEIVRRGTPETYLTIRAPMGGIVTEKGVLEGHYVNEGDHLYTVADLSRVWMQAQIFEDQIAGIEVGQAVAVTGTAYPGEIYAGRIAFIAYTVAAATRTVAARVEVNNPDYKLKPGMYVTATIRLPVGTVTPIEPTTTAASAPADEVTNQGIADLTRAYLVLVGAFAQDKTDPVAATELARQARGLAERGADVVRKPAAAVAEAAAQLADKDLKAQRGLLKELSARVIALLRSHPPDGLTLFIAHCPMVHADWLQTSEEITNPYYGSEMLACGSITGRLEPGALREAEQFATGYFCPIYPDRLFDRPEHCPIDDFPLQYAKVEKVLAVPAAAVINTGTRQIVYRESGPGIFDMVGVELGSRAGEFYPVRGGLNPGDQVATAGAFLVDAENRLNPAAAAQYFGATGAPQSGGHQH